MSFLYALLPGLWHPATAPKYAPVHSFRSQNITCSFFFRVWIIGVWNLGPTKNALVNSFSRCCLEEAGNAGGLPSERFTMCLHFLNWLWSVLRKVFGVFGQTCLYCSGHYICLTWPVLLCVFCKWFIKYGLTTGNPVGLEVNTCPRSLSSGSAKSTKPGG